MIHMSEEDHTMTTTLRVVRAGETVWSDTFTDEASFRQFPDEYRGRPAEDAVDTHELWIDDSLIGVQHSFTQEAAAYEAAAAAEPDEVARLQLLALAAESRALAAARRATEGA